MTRAEKISLHEDIVNLQKEIAQKKANGATASEIQKLQDHKNNRIRALKAKDYDVFQEEWVEERRDWYIETDGWEDPLDLPRSQNFKMICRLIPARRELARFMLAKILLTRDQWFDALRALLALCKLDMTVMFRPRQQPLQGICPAKTCEVNIDLSVQDPRVQFDTYSSRIVTKPKKSDHIHKCLQRDFAFQHQRLLSHVHYCYECFEWIVQEEWKGHCLQHLSDLQSMRCGSWTFCSTLMRPAYCP